MELPPDFLETFFLEEAALNRLWDTPAGVLFHESITRGYPKSIGDVMGRIPRDRLNTGVEEKARETLSALGDIEIRTGEPQIDKILVSQLDERTLQYLVPHLEDLL